MSPWSTAARYGEPLAKRYRAGVLRSRDIHDLVLNHLDGVRG